MFKKLKRLPGRLLVWAKVMLTTSTQKGGRWLFFQRVYFLLNTATVIERLHKPTGRAYRNFLQKHFNREVIIKNTIGTFSVNPKNDSFTKSIASFEYTHQPWLKAATNKNIFIDVGANIGFYSILAVTKYGFERAHVFEPNPDTYNRLKKNIKLNGLEDKITVHTTALSDTKANAQLTAKAVHTGGSTLVKKANALVGASLVEVPTDTFDHLCHEQNISANDIGFIKIDVEGYEYEVLQGMKEILPKLTVGTCLFIEIHPHARFAKETKELIENNNFTLLKSSPQKNFLYCKNT